MNLLVERGAPWENMGQSIDGNPQKEKELEASALQSGAQESRGFRPWVFQGLQQPFSTAPL